MQPQHESQKKRFRLVKLEERIVPAHLATVLVPPAPGIALAQENQPHIEFKLREFEHRTNCKPDGLCSINVNCW